MNIIYPKCEKSSYLMLIKGMEKYCPINIFGSTGKNFGGRVLVVGDVEYDDEFLNLFLKPISRRDEITQ